MSASVRELSRRVDFCLLWFGGSALAIFFFPALYLYLAGNHFFQALVEECLTQCSALMSLSLSATDGIRLALVLGLLIMSSMALAKTLSDARRVREFTGSLQRVESTARFDRLIEECGLSPDRVCLFPSRLSFACTAGLFSPRIYVSTRLFDSLSDGEVKAVLLHEQAHRQRRDPLRGLLLGLFSRLFFFFPPAARLLQRAKRDLELLADARCLAFHRSPDTLASALVKVKRDNQVRTRLMTGFAEEDFLVERLNRLLGLKTGPTVEARACRRTLSQTAAGLVLAFSLVFPVLPLGNAFPKASPWLCRHADRAACCPSGGGAGAHAHCRTEPGSGPGSGLASRPPNRE
jgi:Zn-dependent protease with chaperone function